MERSAAAACSTSGIHAMAPHGASSSELMLVFSRRCVRSFRSVSVAASVEPSPDPPLPPSRHSVGPASAQALMAREQNNYPVGRIPGAREHKDRRVQTYMHAG
eukprot:5658882-Prymnesium_polylepis.1